MPLDATPLNVGNLQVILAGPILRRLTRTSVSIWVALSVPHSVTLHVQELNNPATEATMTRSPVRIGETLWITVLTIEGVTAGKFEANTTYEYWLTSPNWSASRSPDWTKFSYRGAIHPTFEGIPDNLNDLNILHCSGRCPHHNRRDGLAHGHRLLLTTAEKRPHLLILTGDQIYADDIGSALMARIRRVANDLVNINETIPFGPLPPIAGRQAASKSFGLTSVAAKDHIWTLGEYYAMYLLTWSDILWPAEMPSLDSAEPNEVQLQIGGEPNEQQNANIWQWELENLNRFKEVLPDIRRMLANLPTLMIFDDHEITDDWNLNYNWCRSVYASTQGRRVATNGLLAYLLFQHWGNQPESFEVAGTPEEITLNAVSFDSGAWTSNHPEVGMPTLTQLLGLPEVAALPAALPVGGMDLRDLTTGTSIRYDFKLETSDGYPLRLVFLDERTARHFEQDDKPPGRIATTALDQMWPTPLGNAADTPTLLVTPAPVLGVHIIEHVIQPFASLKDEGEETVDFEGWSADTSTFQYLLDRIGAYQKVIILSGDVHFAYTKNMTYSKPTTSATPAHAAQFVSSANKNTIGFTITLHLIGDLIQKFGIVRTRTFYGYNTLSASQRNLLENVPQVVTTLPYDDIADIMLGRVLRQGLQSPAVFSKEVATAYGLGTPDWHYIIEHISDETPAPVGNLLNAMNVVSTPGFEWTGWNRAKSIDMVRALRASDLHLIGKVFVGLPMLARITFQDGTSLRTKQESFISSGDNETTGTITSTVTEVDLG